MMLKLILRYCLRIVLALLALAALVVLLGPWAIYWYGLSNIRTLPQAPTVTLTPEQRVAVLKEFRMQEVTEPFLKTPWHYYLAFADIELKTPKDADKRGIENVIGYVLDEHNHTNLKDTHTMMWHISGAALGIWLSSHWTPEQIITQAYLIMEQSPMYKACGTVRHSCEKLRSGNKQ